MCILSYVEAVKYLTSTKGSKMKYSPLVLSGFLILGCSHSGTKITEPRYVSRIPADTNLPYEEIRYPTVEDMPDSLEAYFKDGNVQAWWHAVAQDTAACSPLAFLCLDWWQMLEVMPDGDTTIVWQENYDTIAPRLLTHDEAGLYHRYPYWYPNDQHLDPDNAWIVGGCLFVYPNQAPQYISHGWITKWIKFKPDRAYLVKARVKVEGGDISFQVGLDYWQFGAASGNVEIDNIRAWNSAWFGGPGWQEIICPIDIFQKHSELP